MGRPTQLSSFHLHLHHKHLALSLSLSVATWIFGHVTLESSKSRSPLKPAESIRKLWFSVAKWMTVTSNTAATHFLFPSVQGSTYLAQPILLRMVEKIFTWRKHQKATWHGLPMGDGGLQVSPKTTNAQLFVLLAPAFFPFNSISCLVMSTPQRFCSKSTLGWGQNGSNRGSTT